MEENKLTKIENIFNWILKSSADPEKISLSVKGAVAVTVFFGINHFIEPSVINDGINSIALLTTQIAQAFSSLVMVYGFLRKIFLSLKQWRASKDIENN